MTFIVDIDDTILKSVKIYCKNCYRLTYEKAEKIKDEIEYLNRLYKNHTIILFTGRNWDCYDITVKQLKKFKVKYHQLIMGKPHGVFIDANAKTSVKDVYNEINNNKSNIL